MEKQRKKKFRNQESDDFFDESFDSEVDSGFGPSLLVPDHRYLGPGNPLENGQPMNRVDEAARTHDLDYIKAETTFKKSGNRE